MVMESREGFLDVDGVRLEYRWIGPGPEEAPTVVMLHEGLGCVGLWRDFPVQLAECCACGVLVYSRAGYGASDPVPLPRPVDYMHVEGLDLLGRVLDVAGVRRCVLLGHSDGASIAIVHAGSGRAGTRVAGLALLAPHVFNEPLCIDSIRAAGVAYETTDLRGRLARYHGDNTDVAFRGWNDVWLHADFEHWNIEEYLPGIEVPLLVIQGEDDEYGTSLQYEAIRRQASGAVETRLLPKCGHSPHRDQPQRTLDALGDFIRVILGSGDSGADSQPSEKDAQTA